MTMPNAPEHEALRLARKLETWTNLHPAMQEAAAELRRLHALTQTGGWVSVDERLPENGKPVLLDIGERFPIRAMWCPAKTLEATADDSGEYDEATDTYWCIEGWYEWNREEEIHWYVSKPALRWTELPLPPSPAAERAQERGR